MPIRALPALILAGLLDAATAPLWTWATPLPPATGIALLLLPDASARRSFLAGLWVDALLGTWGLCAAALSILYAVEFRTSRIPLLASAPIRISLGVLFVAAVAPTWSVLCGRTAAIHPAFFAIQFFFLVILTERPRRELAAV